MFSNYFYLLRSVHELNSKLEGLKIIDAYTQEKNVLFLHIPSNEFEHQHLLISTNPQFPFLQIKAQHQKAKKNVVQFFPKIINEKIRSVEINNSDRLVKIKLTENSLYFMIRGNLTNVLHVDGENKQAFKKTELNFTEIENNSNFTSSLDIKSIQSDDAEYNQIADLKKSFPMISSFIKNEINHRFAIGNDQNLKSVFISVIKNILYDEIAVGFCNDLGKVIFIPNSFKSIVIDENKEIFNNYNSAINHYLRIYYRTNSIKSIEKELDKYFDLQLNKLANKLNKLKHRVNEGSKSDFYYNQANLLLSNIHNINKGKQEITIDNYSGGEKQNIKLDPKLSPKENVNKLFEKAKDEKVNYTKSVELFNITKQNYDSLKSEYDNYQSTKEIKEIEIIAKKLLTKDKNIIKMDSGHKFKYWHYVLDDKYNVYVGRDSKSNDYLSVKFAKQNDYWFHARGLPGSHVVLRVENTKEVIPKDIIKKAAAIAAHHSKAKTAGTASVSYTFAKFVYKKKGMAPGKVLLTKEKTILVRPEIPKNCELINE